MPLSAAQKQAIEEVVNAITTATVPKGRRLLSAMFMSLVDPKEWPEYYEIIPDPRCINSIRTTLEKNRYRAALDAYADLSLVFWNALYYNEAGSQIAMDAETLKRLLETEWKKRTVLPPPRTSPPPRSAQKVHKVEEEEPSPPPEKPPASSPLTAQAAVVSTKNTPIIPTAIPANDASANQNTSNGQPSPEPSSSEEEIDVGSVADLQAHVPTERDAASEEVIRHLDKSLPRWPGFSEEGWMGNIKISYLDLVHAIKSHKDVIGNRYAFVLESVPERAEITYLSLNMPLSLKSIESRARAKDYSTPKDFDVEFMQLFAKARRWHDPGSDAYGHVLLLQRLYQALTSKAPPHGPPYSSPTNFASLRAGPGASGPASGTGVTSDHIPTKGRNFVDRHHYKGWTIKAGDWVHLSNPDYPSLPTIGQVHKCWVAEERSRKGQHGITVCWFFRPEQTHHTSDRTFLEGEVFKTSHFAEHPLEDILEKIACQYAVDNFRGRPRAPYWYPGIPLYVCESRYNNGSRAFVKVKDWSSCMPEESRELVPIYPFERIVSPRRLPSPFLSKGKNGAKASGGLISGSIIPSSRVTHIIPISTTASNATTAVDRSILFNSGLTLGNNARQEKLPPETTKHFDRDLETDEVLWFAAPPTNVAPAPVPKYSLAYLHFLATKRKNRAEPGSLAKRPRTTA
ncbi:uncharacterized protein BT62DRAFT_978771 [Guyanagaster necrorhizus]|uniref:Uncharacterized protein n=1 Tax=Guyanagaster necrorhizus TaxID=856835 RepID=A0A9P7W2C6_9AGAR|nr:uncharacterized protein BT62DRAFT_978771 [Guyanagaster necrorhizus MCA 3950]KAG7450923.1 hypothetical protein BT62DRAFT_978771 [Guyanagaster necrorhizus MCA 3950]